MILRPAMGPAKGPRPPAHRGFTLIEIMLVVGISLLLLGWGAPNMLRALEKHGIAKATTDIMDGCRQARAFAILKGHPAEFVIFFDGHAYQLHVREAYGTRLQTAQQAAIYGGLPNAPEEVFDPGAQTKS